MIYKLKKFAKMTKMILNQVKDTKQLFQMLNISKQTLSEEQRNSLNDKGFVILSSTNYMLRNLNLLNKVTAELIQIEGQKGGWEGKEKNYKEDKFFEFGANRLGNLIDKHEVFRDLILTPEVLAAAYEVIKSDIKISGLNFRNPLKNYGYQALHIDWLSREKESDPFSGVVCFFYLDDVNINNGATRLIPGSHKKLGWPDKYIDTTKSHKEEIRVVVPAGTIVVMNLNLWHAGAKNITGASRKTVFLQIKRRDQPQLLNYKKYLSNKTKSKLNIFQDYLLGIRESDTTQKEDSVGPGEIYRQMYGKDRSAT